MKKVVKLTESHLEKLVRRILEEDGTNQPDFLLKTQYNPNDKSITLRSIPTNLWYSNYQRAKP